MDFNTVMRNILKQDVNERNELKSKCTDKLYVKEYAYNILKEDCTPNTLAIAECVNELLKNNLPIPWVLKANNDSGGVQIIYENSVPNISKIEKYKHKSYGKKNGEWFYDKIQYKCFAEEFLGENMTDYKFHCSNGNPKCCQVIRDRNINIREVIVDLDGNILDFHFDKKFKLIKKFEVPQMWDKMVDWAKKLCKDFDYVRVDLYTVKNEVYVGELTFTPLAGKYKGNGQHEMGKLLFLESHLQEQDKK